jgi:hypothetical protein
MACESFEDLLDVVDVELGAAILDSSSPGPWSQIWYASFYYRLNCRSRIQVRCSDMDTSARSGRRETSDEGLCGCGRCRMDYNAEQMACWEAVSGGGGGRLLLS